MTIEEINEIIKDETYSYGVTVDKMITITENVDYDTIVAIADKVSEYVISDTYEPEAKNPLLTFFILNNFTDCKPEIKEDGTFNLAEAFKLYKSPIGKLIDIAIKEVPSLIYLNKLVDEKIEFKKQQLLHNKKSTMDEAFEELSKLLQTLNSKAEQLDTKKLEKVLKKLNPQEVIKAYQKSNIGDSVRDKAIHEQAQTIIDLKNEISARNVKA